MASKRTGKGRYAGVRQTRPVEIARGFINLSTVTTGVVQAMDLVLEGEAALIMAIDFKMTQNTINTTDDTVNQAMCFLTMDEDLVAADIVATSGVIPVLSEEETIAYMKYSAQCTATTDTGTWDQSSANEFKDFSGMGGILVPETINLGGIRDAGDADLEIVCEAVVYFKRIENPERWMVDYLYRRR